MESNRGVGYNRGLRAGVNARRHHAARKLRREVKSTHMPANISQLTANSITTQLSSDMLRPEQAMEAFAHPRGARGRGGYIGDRGRPLSHNKQWLVGDANSRPPPNGHSEGERWERRGYNGRGRGRGAPRGGLARRFPNSTLRIAHGHKPVVELTPIATMDPGPEDDNDEDLPVIQEPVLETQEEREKLYQELVAAREHERKRAIAEGRMDDPLVPKRLEDAITIVGTCPDMCPRFERYRRERENNLFEWETIPGTKRIDHSRAVKMYERAAGDKTLPSDLRPPHVLRKTLDYLFHDLLPRGTLSRTAQFIRDRSRAVRNDITMQHLTGHLAIECHDRCARFHIIVMHFERDRPGFSLPLEEQQLMNTLQSLKEFYEDQRGRYESPNELEMRVYHRLIHIRDQRERHENIPEHISSHPVFKLTTDFRLHVQKKSEPITKTSALVVDAQAMDIFGRLAEVLREMGDTAMIYLVACILERLFGKDTIENIEAIRGGLTISNTIDGKSGSPPQIAEVHEEEDDEMQQNGGYEEDYDQEYTEEQYSDMDPPIPWPSNPPAFSNQSNPPVVFGSTLPVRNSAFSSLTTTPNVFGKTFGAPASTSGPTSVFGTFTTGSSAPAQSPQPPASFSSLPQPIIFPSTTTEAYIPPLIQPAPISPTPVSAPTPLPEGQPKQSVKHSIFSTAPVLPLPSTSSQPSAPNPPPVIPKAPLFSPSTPFTPALSQSKSSPSDNGQRLDSVQANTSGALRLSEAPLATRERSNSAFGSRRSSTSPPLNIDTNLSSSSSSATSTAAASPREPPIMSRVQPIPLPSTPTTNPPPNALPSYLKGTLSTPSSSSTPERNVLSPLFLQTPQTASFHSPDLNNFSPVPNKSALGLLGPNGKSKVPARQSDIMELPAEVLNIMQEKACTFERSGTVPRKYFGRWLQKVIDQAAYVEACKQSNVYQEKIRLQRSQDGTPDRKRRISTAVGPPAESLQRKRAWKRVSSTYKQPRTDEELAQRFKENQEDVGRRWAQGSFLQVFRTFFKRHVVAKLLPSTWQIWLSMNPESDATAIWIERKFDIPDSGKWISENVFSIPIGTESWSGRAHPGLIVFECTPVEGIDDEIERKYRVLDDCSRLRDIVKSLPARRYYVPLILFLCWTRSPEQYPDLFAMADKLTKDRTIKGHHTMLLNAVDKDPDEKFETSLKSSPLDFEGELVRSFNVRDLYKHFLALVNPLFAEWTSSCSNGDLFNWKLYNLLLHMIVALLNTLEGQLRQLCGISDSSSLGLPEFEDNIIDDSDSAYDYAEEWLSTVSNNIDVSLVLVDIQSHRNIEQEFPYRTLLDHVLEIAQVQAGRVLGEKDKLHLVLADELERATTALAESLAPLRVKLSHRLNTTARRSPKRRSRSVATSETSPESKRMRLSCASSVNGDTTPFSSPVMNGQYTPSPSMSVVSLPPPLASEAGATSGGGPKVTAAMLRALTQDLKKKYVRH